MSESNSEPARPSELAQELGLAGLLERFFAITLDTTTPRYSDVSVPGLLEKRVQQSVAAAVAATEGQTYGLREMLEKRERIASANDSAARARDESITGSRILTRARQDYAHLVNDERKDRRSAAMEVIQNIQEADEANNSPLRRLLSGTYYELTTAARAEREGSMPYRSPGPFTPYVIPESKPVSRILTPREQRQELVARTREAVETDVEDMNRIRQRSAVGRFSMPGMVSPDIAEGFLKGLVRDMQDGVLNNTPRRPGEFNFVPLDKRYNALPEDVAGSVERLEAAMTKRGGAVIDEKLAEDITRISAALTDKANMGSVMQGPAPTPPATPTAGNDAPSGFRRRTASR